MSNPNGGIPFFAGLVTGGVFGASLALLLAPQSGEKTRGQIRAKSLELKDGAVEGMAEAGHRAQEQAAVWQEKGKEAIAAIGRSKDGITQAASQGKNSAVEAIA